MLFNFYGLNFFTYQFYFYRLFEFRKQHKICLTKAFMANELLYKETKFETNLVFMTHINIEKNLYIVCEDVVSVKNSSS